MQDQTINWPYLGLIFATVLGTWLIHEFAHWAMGEALGYSSTMRLNSTSFLVGEEPTAAERTIISAAGPLITIIQALVIFFILKARQWNKYLYPILFTAFYMRGLAGIMNLIQTNDEGRISEYLGLGTYTIPIMVGGLLFYWVIVISKRHKLSWQFQLSTTLLVILASSILILSDQFFKIQLI